MAQISGDTTEFSWRAPLADRMRPQTLDEFIGQEHLVGRGRMLRRAIESNCLQSSVFWGPPGCGKTTLATIAARQARGNFVQMNAVSSGVADVRKVLDEANKAKQEGITTYLLLDECHRWSKAQSDCMLPSIESGLIRFIGSTTENPYVSMTPAIVSRCRVFEFYPLNENDSLTALRRAVSDDRRGLGEQHISIEEDVLEYIARNAGGDIRMALGTLESASLMGHWQNDEEGSLHLVITLADVQQCLQKPVVKMGQQQYYDMLSAFCKSMRGSDPDAALFWYARMIDAGVDPKLIVRRIVVHASEDVGLADPIAMLEAQAAVTALEFVGMPEASVSIAQAIIAVCMAEKSDSVSSALTLAREDAAKSAYAPVPEYLRDHSYAASHSQTRNYRYPHEYPGHFVLQQYLPQGYEHRVYYHPTEQGNEAKLKLRHLRRYGAEHEKNK